MTTEINRSIIWCSEHGNENGHGTPMIEIIATYKGSMKDWMIMKKCCFLLFIHILILLLIDDALHSMDRSLNVSLVNQL